MNYSYTTFNTRIIHVQLLNSDLQKKISSLHLTSTDLDTRLTNADWLVL
jgi:hypothetical protein